MVSWMKCDVPNFHGVVAVLGVSFTVLDARL